MKVNTSIKFGALQAKLKERQARLPPRGLKIKTGIKAGGIHGRELWL
jgi:hypothetical protein